MKLLVAALFLCVVPGEPPPLEKIRGAPHFVRPVQASDLSPATQTSARANYYGGPVISGTQVVVVLWGKGTYVPEVARTEPTPNISSFYREALRNSYMDWLAEYNTSIAGDQGALGSNQDIGRGSLIGQYTITPSNPSKVLSDAAIQVELVQQIKDGHLPPLSQDAAGFTNIYYAIYFPSEIAVSGQGQNLCSYHGALRSELGHLYYGVHPDFATVGVQCGLGQFALDTPFEVATYCAAHEMFEAVTDPESELATSKSVPLAWIDFGTDASGKINGEIADVCIYKGPAPIMTASDGKSYKIHPIWSNAANECVVSRVVNDFSLAIFPPIAMLQAGEANFVVQTSLTSGAAEAINLSAIGLPTGLTAVFSPNPVLPGATSNLSISALSQFGLPTIIPMTIRGVAATSNHSAAASIATSTSVAFASPNHATFKIGSQGSFRVLAAGAPTPQLSASTLPTGLNFVDSGDGSGVISGTPALGTVGLNIVTIAANNDTGDSATQQVALVIEKGSQTIKLEGAPQNTKVGSNFDITASKGESRQPLIFTASGSCLLLGPTVTAANSPGICMLNLSQAGDQNFNPAPEIAQAVAVTLTGDAPTTVSSCSALDSSSSWLTITLLAFALVFLRTAKKARALTRV